MMPNVDMCICTIMDEGFEGTIILAARVLLIMHTSDVHEYLLW